jgi:hypothetical protein
MADSTQKNYKFSFFSYQFSIKFRTFVSDFEDSNQFK